MILDSSSFPLFHGDQVLYELICPLTAVLPRIFFDLTTLSPIQFSFALFMNLLMLLFTSLHFSDPSCSTLSHSGNVDSRSEALPQWNVISLVLVLSILAISGPPSGYFVMAKGIRQYKIVKGDKLQESESSLICVVIAEGSANALPVSTRIPAHFCTRVSLHNKVFFFGV